MLEIIFNDSAFTHLAFQNKLVSNTLQYGCTQTTYTTSHALDYTLQGITAQIQWTL